MTNIGCFQIETKGGQSVLTAENIYIASNKHPCHWWKKGEGNIDWSEQTYRDWETDRKSTRLNSSHRSLSRMPSSA